MAENVPKWIFFYVFMGIYCNVLQSNAVDVKTWRANMNFDNPSNWENGRLPCTNDRVIFPGNTPVIVLMPESFSVAEMILPMDGELIFPLNAEIGITGGNQEGSCVGQDVKFKPSTDFWYDPSNWNITSEAAFPHIESRRNNAVPHAFQMPCPKDMVRFPANSTYRVHVDYPTTSVASLWINEDLYNQDDFDSLKRSRLGKLLFPDDPAIQITLSECTDDSSCNCGNDGPEVFPTICMFEVPCPEVECSDPIQPAGHCCPICASSLKMLHDSGFKMDRLLQLLESFLDKDKFNTVESFTSKTNDGYIQSVFVDGKREKGLASKVAQLVHESLHSDIEGAGLYRLSSVEIFKSERWGPGIPIYDQYVSSGMSSGGVAALVIFIIACLGFAAAFYVYRKRQIPGFTFARFDHARFDHQSDKIELELGTTPHDELEPGDAPAAASEPKSKGFDNPVYGTNITSEAPSTVDDAPVDRDYVENPMFMIFEDSSQKE